MSSPISTKNHKHWLTQALTNHRSMKAFFEPVVQIIKPNWQADNFQATVIENRTESEQVFSLVLKPSKKWPGFKAGQHIDIQTEIDGCRYSRTFSLSHAPEYHASTGLIELTIRIQAHGKVTPWLAKNLQSGSTIQLSMARGEFTLPRHSTPLLFIAGGSGITPFRSFLHKLATTHSKQDIHLIYYNQTKPLFAAEWIKLKKQMPHLKVSLIDTEQQGMITSNQLLHTCPDLTQRLAYLCGPLGLITTSRDLLIDAGVKDADIHHELFGPKPIDPSIQNQAANIYFSRSGKQVKVDAKQTKSLLELAEASNTNPTSGCRMGVCHQCKCHKQQGVVYNTLTESYSDTGAEDIQLCVSVAVGDVTLEL